MEYLSVLKMLTLYPINDLNLYGLDLRVRATANTDIVVIIAKHYSKYFILFDLHHNSMR